MSDLVMSASGAHVAVERPLPDRLSLIHRVQVPCGCIRGVDRISGLAVIDSKECTRD